MNRKISMMILAGSLMMACIPYGFSEVKLTREKDKAVVIENEFFSMVVDPERGGAVVSFIHKPAEKDIIKRDKKGSGLFLDHLWGQAWPGELLEVPYGLEITKQSANEVKVKVWREIKGEWLEVKERTLEGLLLEKTFTVKSGVDAVFCHVALKNNQPDAKSPIYWQQQVFFIGGEYDGDNDVFYRPSVRGIRTAVKGSRPEDFLTDPYAGWSIALDKSKRQGLVFLMDYNYLDMLYNCEGNTTLEWMYDKILIAGGKLWETDVIMVPTFDMGNFVHASKSLIAGMELKRDGKTITASYQLIGILGQVDDLVLSLEFEGITDRKKTKSEPLKVGRLNADKVKLVSQSVDVECKDPMMVRVFAKGKANGQEFNETGLVFHSGGYGLDGDNLQPDKVTPLYKAERPAKQPALMGPEKGVEVRKADGKYQVKTDIYSARVNGEGSLESLVIEGVEFMAPSVEVGDAQDRRTLPPVYACYMGKWNLPYKMPGVTNVHDNVVHAEGNGWTLDYTFLPDAIDISYFGTPEGKRSFRAGYPPAELALSLSTNIARACDPENQGELGWPVLRNHEPGNFAFLAGNGAGFIADDVNRLQSTRNPRIDLLFFNTYDQMPKPITHCLHLFKKADLAHSVTLDIISPNPDHVFARTNAVVFPVKAGILYGHSLNGNVTFDGSPYVWHTPQVKAQVPLALSSNEPSKTISVPIKPEKAGHYTGKISITNGSKPIYSKRVGFIYRPEEIPPAQPPADFDAFWDKTLAELDKIPLDMTLEPQPDEGTPQGIIYKVKYRSWGGRWAWAWLYVPNEPGKYPARVLCPSVGSAHPGLPKSFWQARHYPREVLIYVAVHGGDIKDCPAQSDFDYMNTGITARETYMLLYSYCCLVRCYDIVKKHERCNGEISAEGASQGAGLSLVIAGLRPVKSVSGRAIALCRIDWTVLGYTRWGPGCPKGEDPKKIAEVVRYYDPACFAHRIHAPLKLALGLFDFCAPAEGIFTAINALPKETKCEVFVDPYGGHFSLDDSRSGGIGLEVPRWQGTASENKLRE